MTGKSLAMRALTMATRLRLRGRPWSWIANGVAAFAVGGLDEEELRHQSVMAWEVADGDHPHDCTLMRSEEYIVDRILRPGSRLLVIGSGAGRDLVAYAQRGFQVTGLEPAPGAARASEQSLRDHGLRGTVIQGYAFDVTLTGTFDAVIFSYFCYGYVPTAERRVAILKKLRRHLAPDGSIVISYNLRRSWVLTPLTRLGAWLSDSTWKPEHGDVIYLTGRPDAPITAEHLFADDEIAAETARAGFSSTLHGDVYELRVLTLRALPS